MSDDLEVRVAALDAGVLAGLLCKRAGSDEDFRLWLATQLETLDARERGASLDPEPFRQRAEALLEPASTVQHRRHWEGPHSDIDEAALEDLLGQAQPFLDAGDGLGTLSMPCTTARLASRRPTDAGLSLRASTLAEFDAAMAEIDRLLASSSG